MTNLILIPIVVIACLGASILYLAPSSVAKILLSREEINACAMMIARTQYRRSYDWTKKIWIADVLTQQEADDAFIIDEGYKPDLIATRDSYHRRFGLETVYDIYVNEGAALCLRMKLRGEKIETPQLKLRDGWHVTRSNGSAALVKDGDPEPIFGCSEGYRPTGFGCLKQ